MVKEKFKKSLEKAKKLEKKKIRTLKQLGKAQNEFEEEEKILKKSIGKVKRKRK